MAIVDDIVAQLKRGGLLAKPQDVRTEVQRAIKFLRDCHAGKLPSHEPLLSVSEYRELRRLLRKTGHADNGLARLPLDDRKRNWAEPPRRATDALKHRCADEAFFLMEMFSATAPTLSDGGAYYEIAQKLYEAVTGKRDAKMERACRWIWHRRKGKQKLHR